MIWTHLQVKIKEQIFSLPRNVCPREGTGLKTDFFCKRERESFTIRGCRQEGWLSKRADVCPRGAREDSIFTIQLRIKAI